MVKWPPAEDESNPEGRKKECKSLSLEHRALAGEELMSKLSDQELQEVIDKTKINALGYRAGREMGNAVIGAIIGIAGRLLDYGLIDDFMKFGGVCISWNGKFKRNESYY